MSLHQRCLVVQSRRVTGGNTLTCTDVLAHTYTEYTVKQILLVLFGTSLTDSILHQNVAKSDLLRKAERNVFPGGAPVSEACCSSGIRSVKVLLPTAAKRA